VITNRTVLIIVGPPELPAVGFHFVRDEVRRLAFIEFATPGPLETPQCCGELRLSTVLAGPEASPATVPGTPGFRFE